MSPYKLNAYVGTFVNEEYDTILVIARESDEVTLTCAVEGMCFTLAPGEIEVTGLSTELFNLAVFWPQTNKTILVNQSVRFPQKSGDIVGFVWAISSAVEKLEYLRISSTSPR
jgi:hypothetical protein